MNTEKFKAAYGESRNGANQMYFSKMLPGMVYSDGVKDCAEAGIYWLLDIMATECVRPVLDSNRPLGILYVRVTKGATAITLELQDDVPPVWTRNIASTNLPDGKWIFYLGNDGDGKVTVILPTEY